MREVMMDWTALIITILSITSIPAALIALSIRRLEKKLDKNEKDRADKEAEHWEYERISLTTQMITSDLSIGVAEFAIKQGCNGNTSENLKSARTANADLKAFIQKRATKNI